MGRGPIESTVSIMFEQKPVSVLHLDKYRLLDRSHHHYGDRHGLEVDINLESTWDINRLNP